MGIRYTQGNDNSRKPETPFSASVTGIDKLANDVWSVKMRCSSEFKYLAGQYIEIAFGNLEPRPYSIAGIPRRAEIEIHVKHFGNGGASAYIAQQLKTGEKVCITGPYGQCSPDHKDTRPLLAIAGGLGITPMKSIIEDCLETTPERSITLYWGTNTPDEMYLKAHFEDLEKKNPQFHFVAINGAAIGATAIERFEDITNACIYMAGPPAMIDDTLARMTAIGCERHHINFDDYRTPAKKPKIKPAAQKSNKRHIG